MLLNSSNFMHYRNGRKFRYVGGFTKSSPVVLTVPSSGHWHGVVDVRGVGGQLRASIRVLPNALAPLRQQTNQRFARIRENADIIHATDQAEPTAPMFDVFISHAAEDKEGIVRQLAHELSDAGLSVWYDEFELRVGDSLRRKIDAGLARSRFGVVVLSPAFFKKNWPQYELDGLVTREMAGDGQVILPVWHGISKDDILRHSPPLADKVALKTADLTVEEVAAEIAAVVRD